MNDKRVSHRDLAVNALGAAQVFADHIQELRDERQDAEAVEGSTGHQQRSARLSQQIGEANIKMDLALKMADVHATLAVAEAIGALAPRGVEEPTPLLLDAPEYESVRAPRLVRVPGVSDACHDGMHDACQTTAIAPRCGCVCHRGA